MGRRNAKQLYVVVISPNGDRRGALSTPAPAPAAAIIQIAPSASTMPAQPISPISADINEQRVAPQQEINATWLRSRPISAGRIR